MIKVKPINVYRCTVFSGRDMRNVFVCAHSFGSAAKLCRASISNWDNSEAYEITQIEFVNSCFIKSN